MKRVLSEGFITFNLPLLPRMQGCSRIYVFLKLGIFPGSNDAQVITTFLKFLTFRRLIYTHELYTVKLCASVLVRCMHKTN